MPHDRVPRASERIEEAARWVDLALFERDREANEFHTNQERCRQRLQSLLLRLQVWSVLSGDPERVAHEVRRFHAAFQDTLREAEEICRGASVARLRAEASPRPSPN
jgi:hypothetical protein